MKKSYIAPQNNVVSSRIRTSILAGSNAGTPGAPSASGSTDLNGGSVQDYDPTNDGGLGAKKRNILMD